MQKAKTKLSTVADEFRELDLIFKSGSYLDVVEMGYARKLIHAMSSRDEVMESEALKSLGDLYLHKAKINDNKTRNFNKACALYMESSRCCTSEENEQATQHRIKYAERCTKLAFNEKRAEQGTELTANTTLAVSATLDEVKENTKKKGQGEKPLIKAYAESFLTAIVDGNKCLEVESLKSLGDLYLEKGRVGQDDKEVTKAAGLYLSALERCQDPDGKETLNHRINYAEKVKEKVWKKRQETRLCGNSRLVDETQDQEDTDSIYKEHLQEGCRALQTGDLDTAEQKFAAALKEVHVQDPNATRNRKETEPLCKLSDVYLKRGMQSKDGSDFTKAAALCNAALVRSRTEDREDIKQTILKITQSFVKYVLGIAEQTVDIGEVEKHKLLLRENRDYVEKEMKRIEEQVDPYSLDDDDPNIKDVEKKRAEAIKALFETIVHQRRTFIADLVDECMEVMGPPPCKYAMIGLGSQATGLVTPYSDLEFAILVEKETESNVKYFRNLTHYLHLKVINLGETILPAMAISSLNDFYSEDPLDNWYYDSVTPRGFSFDGAMPHACKTPLGRGKASELILTPSKMVQILKDDLTLHLKKGYHLASVLGNVCLITGDQDLLNAFTALWTQHLQKNNGEISRAIATSTLIENAPTFEVRSLSASLLNVKKDIYRFSSLALFCWALLCDIQPSTIWETIQKLMGNGVIDGDNAHHLMVLVSISAELRLRTYMNNRGQVENMSALTSISTDIDIGEKLKKVFYFSNTKQLMRYYYTARPLKHFISQIPEGLPLYQPTALYDNSSRLQAEVYLSLGDYQKSKTCTKQALQDDLSTFGTNTVQFSTAQSLNRLGVACENVGDHRKAIIYYEKSLQMLRCIYGENTAHPYIGGVLSHLGSAWSELGDNKKAISYYELSLQMRRTIYGESTAHPDIAVSLNDLGNAWRDLGDDRKAIGYYEVSLQMLRCIYGKNKTDPYLVRVLSSLGNAWGRLGNHREAMGYHRQSLKIAQTIYGESTAHPDIAGLFNGLAADWANLGDYSKAMRYHEQSLKIMRSIYGEGTAHPYIAKALSSLGDSWRNLGEHRKAVSYYEESLKMMRGIYGENTAHPDIAMMIHDLGTTWGKLDDHRKAVSHLNQSLEMMLRIHGERTAHPGIAQSLHNLGTAWRSLGDHRKAISHHEQALQMLRCIYGKRTPHPDVAACLNSLGADWTELGDHRKALNYFQQSLEMKLRIYGENSAHPDIASSLLNLGTAWGNLGDYRKAVDYYDQARQMKQRYLRKRDSTY